MGTTEKIGIGHLESFVAGSRILVPYFKENDKTPTFDGCISLHKVESKKDNYIANISVQIKSIVVKKFHNGKTSYNISKTDFDNIYNERGIIFFVVEILNLERKIFVKSLLPYEIKRIIAKIDTEQKDSASIQLEEIEFSNIKKLEFICKHFHMHKKMQYSTIESSLDIKDASKLQIPLVNEDEINEEYIFNREYLLYGSASKEGLIQFIKPLRFSSFANEINKPVRVDGKQYYERFKRIKKRDGGEILEFGNIVIFPINSGKFSFELLGNLNQGLVDMQFLLDLFSRGEASLGSSKIRFNNIENDEELFCKVENNVNSLDNIKKLLEYFKIDASCLLLNEIDKWEYRFIDLLINSFIYNQKYRKIPLEFGFNAIKIGNLYLGVFAMKFSNCEYFNLIDLFDEDINELQFAIADENEKMIPSSPYLGLKSEFLLSLANFDIDMIYENIISIEFSNTFGNAIMTFILEFIHCWDKTKDIQFLDYSKKLLQWIIEQSDNDLFDLCKINEIQINQRLGKLTQEERDCLFSLREKYSTDDKMLCGIGILLENKSDAEYYFNQLTDNERKVFVNFPIFTLAKNHGMFTAA